MDTIDNLNVNTVTILITRHIDCVILHEITVDSQLTTKEISDYITNVFSTTLEPLLPSNWLYGFFRKFCEREEINDENRLNPEIRYHYFMNEKPPSQSPE